LAERGLEKGCPTAGDVVAAGEVGIGVVEMVLTHWN
jgi:hypothetical protein